MTITITKLISENNGNFVYEGKRPLGFICVVYNCPKLTIGTDIDAIVGINTVPNAQKINCVFKSVKNQ